MAFGNIEINIANESRPCTFMLRNEWPRDGIFHGWFIESHVVPPSNLRGGYPGGTVQNVVGLVEDKDGKIYKVNYDTIRFLDNKVERIFKEGYYAETPSERTDLQSRE